MNGRYWLIVALIVACCAAGCVAPAGALFNSRSGPSPVDGDAMWVVGPYFYEYNDLFLRDELSVLAISDGSVAIVPVGHVEIQVYEDPEGDEYQVVPASDDEFYVCKSRGRNRVIVLYNNMSFRYYIEVTDPYGIGKLEDDEKGGGIVIKWGCQCPAGTTHYEDEYCCDGENCECTIIPRP